MDSVIFDLDQTILDRNRSLLDYVRWQAEGMLRADVSNVDAFVTRFIELDSNGRVWKDRVYEQLLSEFKISGWAVNELLAVYKLCFCSFARPMAGAIDAITSLKDSGYLLGLISNGMSPFQERNFRALGVSTLFDSVLVSQAVNLRKPDAKIFHMCCRELGVLPESAVYVGDNPDADIRGANDVGMKTVFIPSVLHPRCDDANAVCKDLHHLPELIKNLG